MQKVLITGITGQIGKGLLGRLDNLFEEETKISLLKNKASIHLPQFNKLDLNVIKEINKEYDLAIHLAAITDTNYCRKPENHKEVKNANIGLTKKVCDSSSKVIFLSTDYVFKGDLKEYEAYTEDTPYNPFDFYGETKAIAEEIVLKSQGSIIRVDTMMGIKNKIVAAAKNAIQGGEYFPFYNNYFIRPSFFPDFLNALLKIKDIRDFRIYHISCNGDALSRAQMANLVLEVYIEKGKERALDCLEEEPAPKTKRFALDTKKTKQILGIDFIDSKEAVKRTVL